MMKKKNVMWVGRVPDLGCTTRLTILMHHKLAETYTHLHIKNIIN